MERTKKEIEKEIENKNERLNELKEELEDLEETICEHQDDISYNADYDLDDYNHVLDIKYYCENLLECLDDKKVLQSNIEDLENDLDDLEQELEDFNYETIEKMLEEKTHISVSVHEDYINFEISRMGFDFIAMIYIDMRKFNWKNLRIKVLQEQKEQLQAYIDNIEDCTYDAYEFVENEFMDIVKAITEIIEKEGE